MIARDALPPAATKMASNHAATSAFQEVTRQPRNVTVKDKNQIVHAMVKETKKKITGRAANGAPANQKHLVILASQEVLVVAPRVVPATRETISTRKVTANELKNLRKKKKKNYGRSKNYFFDYLIYSLATPHAKWKSTREMR